MIMDIQVVKREFESKLRGLLVKLESSISTSKQWNIKGFIDMYQTIFTISSDTKVISKVMELQMYPMLQEFADDNGYDLVLPDKQNWYPDMTFVKQDDKKIIIAVDIKTSYRDDKDENFCNGFTLGSHGKYFQDRSSKKNIQFPYEQYIAHYCLGVIYSRGHNSDERQKYHISDLPNISSVIRELTFFLQEKWKIASDTPGSGNTAHIGSITYIPDILSGNGMFVNLGEEIFDDYWINYRKIEVFVTHKGKRKKVKVKSLKEYAKYRKIESTQINPKKTKKTV